MSGCLYLIKQFLPNLAPSERKVADYLLANPMLSVSLGVQEIARQTQSSPAACIRFANRLGFKGYAELRLTLAKEVFSSEQVHQQESSKQVTEHTSAQELVHLVVDSTCESLKGIEEVIDVQSVERAVDAILHASHILISGVGASGIVAVDLQQKLARLGLQAVYTADSDMQIVEACALKQDAVLVSISYSGETNSVLKVAREAKKNGSKILAITRIGGNSLSRLADCTLHVANSESLFREGATLSRIGQLLVVDFIYTMILARRQKEIEPLLKRSWEAVAHVTG
ncbi:MAG: MurR/RpiR family transcriptional regulator [Sphaerochaeta sp.]|jgi:DNA-binding MurR/RpiR family transcriptional regulator|uniref:MurR/RpiR family transcriptional regulator n=1 Tax=Sphaerochaeta sp. TaxID=1972642 RepID=UPI002FCBD58C